VPARRRAPPAEEVPMIHHECRVLLIEDNAVNALLVQKMLKSVESPVFHVTHADSLLKALELAGRSRFDAALVDLNLPDSNGLETFLAIQRTAPSLAIVVLSACESDEIAIQAVEMGAQDYLNKQSLSAADLVRALNYGIIRSRKRAEEQPNRPPTNVLGFLGSKGGVGTTTLACHAARELKRQTNEDVLLTGLDMSSAGVAYLMKTPQQYTLTDAAQNLHRLDADLWRGLVTSTADGIDVMAPPGAAQFTGLVENDRLHQVLRFARGLYRHVVVDLGTLNPLSLTMLEDCSKAYVVAEEELTSLWEAGRLLNRLTQLGLGADRAHFVVNGKKRRGGLSNAELEKAIGHEVHATVAECREELEDLYASGRFVDAKSQIHKDVAKLVARFLGKEVRPDSGSVGFSFARLVRA
jgi:pilus assembly protein CpaE